MPTTLGRYQLGKTLGSGVSCKVKLAKDADGTRYAVKILHSDEAFADLIKTEVETLTKLHHPGIVNMIENSRGVMSNDKKGSKEVDYIVLELVNGGELFDFIANSGRFEEPIARNYFGQLLEALNYMHTAGTSHRDLKPENLMLDKDFNLKIADFGFAAPTEGRDGQGYLETQLGTASYMAPEIHLGKPYTGAGVDLFACAIILFVMLSQRPPFNSPSPDDPHYRLLAGNRADLFWRAHEEAEGANIYSPEFMDLFVKMTALNPAHRLSIAEIRNHAWMKGTTSSKDQVHAEFLNRKKQVDEEAHNERDEKRRKRAERDDNVAQQRTVHRGDADKEHLSILREEEEKEWDLLDFKDYDGEFASNTQFFTTAAATPIFRDILEYLRKKAIEASVDKDYWKLKFSIPDGKTSIDVKVKVLRVDEDKLCVEFSRSKGDQLKFFDHYKQMMADDLIGSYKDTVLAQ